jgi:peptidoglycan/LPS O-acetylase OafA/YrhL
MAWVKNNNIPMGPGLLAGLGVVIASIAIAYACLKLYDEPVREWLRKRFLVKKAA